MRATKSPRRRSRESMDRTFVDLGRLFEGQEFESVEDANAELQKLLARNGGQVPHAASRTPLERAQDVCFQA